MGCATGTVRLVMFIANVVFLLGGIAMVTTGVLALVKYEELPEYVQEDFSEFFNAPIASTVLGSLVVVISFLGCCGACQRNTCMLTSYAVILIVILLAQVAIAIYLFVVMKDREQLAGVVRKSLNKLIRHAVDNKDPAAVELMDTIQSTMSCCGANGRSDWGSNVPASCATYQNGCVGAVTGYIDDNKKVVGGVLLGIGVVELVPALIALCLSSSIKNDIRRSTSY